MLPPISPIYEVDENRLSQVNPLAAEDLLRLQRKQHDLNKQSTKTAPVAEVDDSECSSPAGSHRGSLAQSRSRPAFNDGDSGFFSRQISAAGSLRSKSLDDVAFHYRLESAGRMPSAAEGSLSSSTISLQTQSQEHRSDNTSTVELNDLQKPEAAHTHQPRHELGLRRSRSQELAERPSLDDRSAPPSSSPIDQQPVLSLNPTPAVDPVRDLILPVPHPGLEYVPSASEKRSSGEIDPYDLNFESALAAAQDPEKSAADPLADPEKHGHVGYVERTKAWVYSTYAPQVDAPLILPTAPTDTEKYGYLHTNRLPLYAVGLFSFFSLSAGMWLFVVSSKYFAWFGVFCTLLQLYMGISYLVGLVGKDFDFENHKKVVRENPILPKTCPTVDIYLPCCKEPMEILRNTYEHVAKLEYPAGKLKVYVLDDGDMPAVRELATSFGYNYIVRDDRPRLKKAGNLRWAFARTQGDFFNIYDADFCPRPDFLLELLPMLLADEKVAIVQSPQFFRTLDSQTWVEQGAGAVQELFYRVVQVNRDRWGAAICVGSNAIYRRAALEEVGGTAEIGFSEDVHTGFGCVDRGWKVKYNPLCLACGVCPDTPRAFFSQQMRWCMGSTTLLSNPEFWRSNLTRTQKICYLCGMMYYSAVSLSIFINPLPGIFLLWIRPEYFKYYNLAFALPSLLYTLVTFRLWAKASFSINVQFVMVIQSYAYLTAIKDRIFGRALAWVPSGDNKAHKNNKYRNMRILAWSWLMAWEGALIAGIVYRVARGMAWYNCIPLLVLDTFNLFVAHRFLLCK